MNDDKLFFFYFFSVVDVACFRSTRLAKKKKIISAIVVCVHTGLLMTCEWLRALRDVEKRFFGMHDSLHRFDHMISQYFKLNEKIPCGLVFGYTLNLKIPVDVYPY